MAGGPTNPLPEELRARLASTLASGEGRLVFERVAGRSEAVERAARSPLHVYATRTRATGDGASCVWCSLTGLGAGFVDGDQVSLAVRVGAGARALVGTQSNTRAYRGARGSSQSVSVHVEADALLAWLPEPTTLFAGARFTQQSVISLAKGASLLWVEGFTAGRIARGERWDFSHLRADFRLEVAQVERAHDALVLDASHGPLRARMGRFDAFATLWFCGPLCAGEIERARDRSRDRLEPRGVLRRVGQVLEAPGLDPIVVVRYAAERWARIEAALRDDLAGFLALLGDDPLRRRP